MSFARTHRRLACWLASLVVLLAALAPAVSQAMGATGGVVCTPQGVKWVSGGGADAGNSGGAPMAAHVLEHCPFCSIHAPTLGLPPAPLALPPVAERAGEPPTAFLAAPRTLHAWVSAQPRAPPLFS